MSDDWSRVENGGILDVAMWSKQASKQSGYHNTTFEWRGGPCRVRMLVESYWLLTVHHNPHPINKHSRSSFPELPERLRPR